MNQNFNQLGIINKALYKIGAQRMGSVNDANNANTPFVNDIYLMCLQEVLEEHVWSFAIQTVAIATLTLSTPLPVMNDGVSNPYGLPSDFVNPYLFGAPCFIRFEMIKPPYVSQPTLALLSDNPNIPAMKYVFLNQDPTTYSAKFCDALACKLAKELCFKITEFSSKADNMEVLYSKSLLSAIGSDSNTGSPDQPIANEWFVARVAGSGVISGLPNGNVGFYPDPYNPGF